ncbi:MAG: hypothetical protein V2G48_07025 [bacterium JZ-2024 1]
MGRLFVFSSLIWLFLATGINLGSRWALLTKGQPWYFSFTLLHFSLLFSGWLFPFVVGVLMMKFPGKEQFSLWEFLGWLLLQIGLLGEFFSIPGGLRVVFYQDDVRNVIYFCSAVLQALAMGMIGVVLFFHMKGNQMKEGVKGDVH